MCVIRGLDVKSGAWLSYRLGRGGVFSRSDLQPGPRDLQQSYCLEDSYSMCCMCIMCIMYILDTRFCMSNVGY